MSDPVNARKIGKITAGVLLLVAACAYLTSVSINFAHRVGDSPATVVYQTGPVQVGQTTTTWFSVEASSVTLPEPQRTRCRAALLAAGVGIILIIAGVCARNPPGKTG
jgi:hypothetical protein